MKNTLETRLGIFFALALIVAVIILELVGGADFFKGGYHVKASFKTVQELRKTDPVKLAGVEIGRVESIKIENGRALVTMKIDLDHEIKIDAKALVKFSGLMGQNFVSIDGGTAEAPKALEGHQLETLEQPDLNVLMAKLEGVAVGVEGLTKSFSPDNFSTLLGPVTDFMKQNKDNLTAMIGNMKNVSDQIAQGKGSVGRMIMDESFYQSAFTTVTNLQAASADLRPLLSKGEGMITQLRDLVDGISSGRGTLGKLAKDEALYSETVQAMTSLREILGKINQGQGSVGKLVNDDSFLKNAKLSLQKLDKATDSLEDQGPLSILGLVITTLF